MTKNTREGAPFQSENGTRNLHKFQVHDANARIYLERRCVVYYCCILFVKYLVLIGLCSAMTTVCGAGTTLSLGASKGQSSHCLQGGRTHIRLGHYLTIIFKAFMIQKCFPFFFFSLQLRRSEHVHSNNIKNSSLSGNHYRSRQLRDLKIKIEIIEQVSDSPNTTIFEGQSTRNLQYRGGHNTTIRLFGVSSAIGPRHRVVLLASPKPYLMLRNHWEVKSLGQGACRYEWWYLAKERW